MKRLKRLLAGAALAVMPVTTQAQVPLSVSEGRIGIVGAYDLTKLSDWDFQDFLEYNRDPWGAGAGAYLRLELESQIQAINGLELSIMYFNTDAIDELVELGGRFHERWDERRTLNSRNVSIEGNAGFEVRGNWRVEGEGFRARIGRRYTAQATRNLELEMFSFMDIFDINVDSGIEAKVNGEGSINIHANNQEKTYTFDESIEHEEEVNLDLDIKARGMSIGLRPGITYDMGSVYFFAGAGIEVKQLSWLYSLGMGGQELELPNDLSFGDQFRKIKPNYEIGIGMGPVRISLEDNSIVSHILKFEVGWR